MHAIGVFGDEACKNTEGDKIKGYYGLAADRQKYCFTKVFFCCFF